MNNYDETETMDSNDISKNKTMAILSYISFLCIIPIIAAPESKYARFHANQGLVLFIGEIALRVIHSVLGTTIFNFIWFFSNMSYVFHIIGLIFIVCSIVGIVNAYNGTAKKIPVIGDITILK
jgi:uncharacterized membrane protein